MRMSQPGSLSATSNSLRDYLINTIKRYSQLVISNRMKKIQKLSLQKETRISHFKMIMKNSFNLERKKKIRPNMRRKKKLFQNH